MGGKPRLAFLFRYGAGSHTELFHALPQIIQELSRHVDIHYWSMRSDVPPPEMVSQNAHLHFYHLLVVGIVWAIICKDLSLDIVCAVYGAKMPDDGVQGVVF